MLGLRLRLDSATQLKKHMDVQIQKCVQEIRRLQKLLQWYEDEWNVSELDSRVWKVRPDDTYGVDGPRKPAYSIWWQYIHRLGDVRFESKRKWWKTPAQRLIMVRAVSRLQYLFI